MLTNSEGRKIGGRGEFCLFLSNAPAFVLFSFFLLYGPPSPIMTAAYFFTLISLPGALPRPSSRFFRPLPHVRPRPTSPVLFPHLSPLSAPPLPPCLPHLSPLSAPSDSPVLPAPTSPFFPASSPVRPTRLPPRPFSAPPRRTFCKNFFTCRRLTAHSAYDRILSVKAIIKE